MYVESESVNAVINDMVKEIRYLEDKLAEREWIPCSERLPDLDGHYLVTAKGAMNPDYVTVGCCLRTTKLDNKWIRRWDDETGYPMEVIAWMPLPEPYRGDEK